MAIWDKIWRGIKTFGTAIISGLTMAAEGAVVGSAAGPIGTMVGAIGGAFVGVGLNMGKILDFVNNPDGDSDNVDATQILNRPAGQINTAISHAVANPKEASSKIIMNTLEGIKQGGTWRSSFAAAGGNQFGRAITDGQIQGLINKAAGKMGVSPVTLLAHGNGAFRSLMSRQSQSSTMFHQMNDHVLGAAYPIAAKAMLSTYSGGATGFGRNGAGTLQSSSSGFSI